MNEFWKKIRERVEHLRELSKQDAILRQRMIESAKSAKEISPQILQDESKYCVGELAQHFNIATPGRDSTGKKVGMTLWDAFGPGADDVKELPGHFNTLQVIASLIDAITSNLLADEIDKMSPQEARAAFTEIDGTIKVIDTVLGSLGSYVNQRREQDLVDYKLWRMRTKNETSDATERFFSERYKMVREQENAIICYTSRRERLSALRARLAKKAMEPIRS